MDPQEPKPGDKSVVPSPEESFTGNIQNALLEIQKYGSQLDEIEIPKENLPPDHPKIKDALEKIKNIRRLLDLASGHPSEEVRTAVEEQVSHLREKRSKLTGENTKETLSPSTPSSNQNDGVVAEHVVAQPNEVERLEQEKRKNAGALSDIADSLRDVPETLDELKKHYDGHEVALKLFARNDEYSPEVHQKATEALMILSTKIKDLQDKQSKEEEQRELKSVQQEVNANVVVGGEVDLDLNEQPKAGEVSGSEIFDVTSPNLANANDVASATDIINIFDAPTPVGETQVVAESAPESIPVAPPAEEIPVLTNVEEVQPIEPVVPPKVEMPALAIVEPEPQPAPVVPLVDASLDFTPPPAPKPEIAPVKPSPDPKVILPSPQAQEKAPSQGWLTRVLRPKVARLGTFVSTLGTVLRAELIPKPKESLEARGMREIVDSLATTKDTTKSEGVSKSEKVDVDLSQPKQENVLDRMKRFSERATERGNKLAERFNALEQAKKITVAAKEGFLEIGKRYNELPRDTKIKIGIALAGASLLTGTTAALAVSTMWRAIGSAGTFVSLSEALRLNYETKTGEKRSNLRAGLHTAGALTFSVLIGTGLMGDAIREMIPSGMFEWMSDKTVPTTPTIPENPLAQAQDALAQPDKGTGLKPFDNQGTIGTPSEEAGSWSTSGVSPEYTVQSGDSLYKIIRENFEEIKSLPKGQQDAAIMNVLKHMSADPQFYGVSSGNLETIIAGKDILNLEKIHEILDIRDLIKGESLIEHVQKLDPQTVIDNNVTPAPVEITPPVETPTPEKLDVESSPLLEETKKTMTARLDSIFGVKDVFGTISTPGEQSSFWLAIKEKAVGDLLTEPSPSKVTTDVKNLLGNLSLESGLPVVRGEHVGDYVARALLKISEDKANATV